MKQVVLNWKRGPEDSRDRLYSLHLPTAGPIPPAADISKHMSPVKDQGDLGCCVGEASTAAVEYLERIHDTSYVAQRWSGSVLFAYYNARVDKAADTGAFIRDSIKAMAKVGLARAQFWPWHPEKYTDEPTAKSFTDAGKWKITEYLKLQSLMEIKQALALGFPVLLGFDCYESLLSDSTALSGEVPLPAPGEQIIGGHAICIVGYDDTKGLLKFKNSWGKNWGKGGYGFLPYGYVPKHADEYWVVRK